MKARKDVAHDLANYIVRTKFDDIPCEVVEMAKRFILDSLGVAAAGSTAPGSKKILELIEAWGGREESTVFIFGKKVPAPQAAFINSILIHSRDFDDTHDVAVVHANAPVLPSALAVAEQKHHVTGKEFITAVIVGIDLACRLGLALKFYKGWHYSAICGGFGAAATASKILELNESLTSEALGIVYSQIAGNVQCVRDGSLTKRMQPAFAAKAGVLSAYLSSIGITGTKNTFQGPYGFFRLYDGDSSTSQYEWRHRESGQYGPQELLAELGKRFEVTNLSMKPYPSCRATHPAIEGVLDICREEKIEAEEVKRVTILVSERTNDKVGRPFEIDEGLLQVKAQFSIPYTVAVAIYKGDVFIGDFEEENIRNEKVLDLARKVTVVIDKRFTEIVPLNIDIETNSGRRYVKEMCSMRGSPENPLTEEQRIEKVKKCFQFSATPFSNEKIERMIQAVNHLEDFSNIEEFTRLL